MSRTKKCPKKIKIIVNRRCIAAATALKQLVVNIIYFFIFAKSKKK